jgi:hypothetical protein
MIVDVDVAVKIFRQHCPRAKILTNQFSHTSERGTPNISLGPGPLLANDSNSYMDGCKQELGMCQ